VRGVARWKKGGGKSTNAPTTKITNALSAKRPDEIGGSTLAKKTHVALGGERGTKKRK